MWSPTITVRIPKTRVRSTVVQRPTARVARVVSDMRAPECCGDGIGRADLDAFEAVSTSIEHDKPTEIGTQSVLRTGGKAGTTGGASSGYRNHDFQPYPRGVTI